jgi:hypothetical protein
MQKYHLERLHFRASFQSEKPHSAANVNERFHKAPKNFLFRKTSRETGFSSCPFRRACIGHVHGSECAKDVDDVSTHEGCADKTSAESMTHVEAY